MKPVRCVPLLLLMLTTGCHVVDRASSCGKLSAIAKKAAPEIAATKISDSPSSEILRKKSRLYGQLAKDLDQVPFKDPAVKAARSGMVAGLTGLAQHLVEAAQAIEAQKKFLERQKHAAARHEEILAEKRKYTEKLEDGPAGSSTPPSAPKSAGKKPIVGREVARVVGPAGFGRRARSSEGPVGAFSPTMPSANASPHTYAYERAKRAAEAATRSVESGIRNLETACR